MYSWAMITSHCLACSVGMTAAKADSTKSGLSPSLAAIALPRSTSLPTSAPVSSWETLGGVPSLGAQIFSVPACRIAGGATFAGPVLVRVDSSDEDEQPDRATAPAMTQAMAIFFTVPP